MTKEQSDKTHVVKRDGTVLETFNNGDEAFAWLLNHQPNSVYHALKHEGYSIEAAD